MQGTPKAIEIKGIVRNATVIGAQDGQAEDLINLRFMDGSWRASGDGRQIENMPTGTIYQQLYVHTNVYHHLLGVYESTLYWFAEIGTDGTTFYSLDNTTSRTQWPEDFKSLPTAPVALTTVVGDIWITQTGHLLTIIDENDDFEYIIYKLGDGKYKTIDIDENGASSSRSLFPYGKIHFNLEKYSPQRESLNALPDDMIGSYWFNDQFDLNHSVIDPKFNAELIHTKMVGMYAAQQAKNRFTRPFMAIAAIRDYDNKYHYASVPVLLNFGEAQQRGEVLTGRKFVELPVSNQEPNTSIVYTTLNAYYDGDSNNNILEDEDSVTNGTKWSDGKDAYSNRYYHVPKTCINVKEEIGDPGFKYYDWDLYVGDGGAELTGTHAHMIRAKQAPVFSAGIHIQSQKDSNFKSQGGGTPRVQISPANLTMSIDERLISFLGENEDVFKSIAIFITPEVDVCNLAADATGEKLGDINFLFVSPAECFGVYKPYMRSVEQVSYDLLHSNFYLLREYTWKDIINENLISNPRVDLSKPEYDNVLSTITSQTMLNIEASGRTTYVPKVVYYYNNRLHIADYKSHIFYGYPLECFHLHNHCVKIQNGGWFPADEDGKRVLPYLIGDNDELLQWGKTDYNFVTSFPEGLEYFAYIKVNIDSYNGEQVVVRYIHSYEHSIGVNGRADFIESLNPIITYPDIRAKSIQIGIYRFSTENGQGQIRHIGYTKYLSLKPHPYLNIAYYIDPDLKPISFVTQSSTLGLKAPKMQNTEEYYPNGLKVSSPDNPLNFPVENTYQVGSAEILALMSNTIAVGTGQTGDAPLYVFCKDGVYALYVDASGQMAYPNARILARDVCNNPRSVTPIDAGVVFTTDRGLMMIAGEQVEEIGQPAEGDVVQFWNAGSVDYSKIATASMQQIAGLPSNLCSTTDFLTYLQDKGTSGKAAIINYNHNMRELMVSNPNYPYSYVLDREGNWSRRDYTAAQYVNNYPTSYRVDADGHFYKVDDEGDAGTSLEHRKEADNKIFYLSNVIKLDSIGFKQAYRFVVRGYFETIDRVAGIINGREVYIYGVDIPGGETRRIVYRQYYVEGDYHWFWYNGLDPIVITIIDKYTGEDVTHTCATPNASQYFTIEGEAGSMACVVEGSYDGIKFAPLGFNRKSGKFTNIGCHVSHTDVRFYRVILCGQVTGKTRIDYMELSADGSVLNTKIR